MSASSLRDVAKHAGVSIGTVSNVLNRPELVAPATRSRVEASIATLGFVRNESARQLRAKSSRTLAYVVLDAANPFFTDVARGVEEVAREHDLALFLCDTGLDSAREADYLDLLIEQRVRGVLVTSNDYSSEALKRVATVGIPLVLVDRLIPEDAPSEGALEWCTVGVRDIEGGELAVGHLLEHGHQRIVFAGGPMSTTQVQDRLTGARRSVADHGLPASSLRLLETDALTVAEGRRIGERILGLPKAQRPTGIFCANDLLALGVLQHLTMQGLSVPDDYSLIGYDDIEFASAAAVPLTSVSQPRQQIGRAAAELLLDEASDPEHEHRSVEFMPELIVRYSTGPASR